jgi:hypothetical protein
MPTVSDLGRQIKLRYPGEYDDLSDAEVGRRVKAKYPEYGDYVDEALTPERHLPTPVTKALQNFATPVSPVEYSTEENIQRVVDYYNPNRGRLISWWQRGKAESRNKLLTVLNEEQLLVIEQGALLEESYRRKQKSEVEYQVWLAQNASVLHQLLVNERLINNALEKGMTLDGHQRVIEASELSKLQIDEHQRRVEIDLEARWKSIVQDLDAADLLQISERQVIRKLLAELSETRRERYAILTGNDPEEVKIQILSDYDKHISNLELHLDARQTRLLLSENGQETRRLEEGPPDSGDDS